MTATIDPDILTKPHVRPTGDQIVILPVYREYEQTQTASGIYIDSRITESGIALADVVENEPIEGWVVALGDGLVDACPTCYPNGKRHEFTVKIGDKVLWTPWLALTITLDGRDYNLISERDVLGIISAADQSHPVTTTG